MAHFPILKAGFTFPRGAMLAGVCAAAFYSLPALAADETEGTEQEIGAQADSVAATAGAVESDDAAVSGDAIVVTGSRVVRSGFNSPTPTTIINSDQFDRRAVTNIADIFAETPAFQSSTNPQTTGVRSVAPGANFADLRGLGSTRTLVLVDGRRFTPQINALEGYQVDLNQVPSLLIDRVEVVTGSIRSSGSGRVPASRVARSTTGWLSMPE